MKNYSNAIKDALINENPLTDLYVFNFSSGPVYLTTAAHDIMWSGITYTAGSLVLSSDDIKQQQELRVSQFTVVLTAVDQTLLAILQNANQQNRRVTLRRVVLTETHQVIDELISVNYFINSYSVDDNAEEATVSLDLTNSNGNFESVKGIRTTQNSFKRFYPNTTSFINSKDTKKELKWGGK